MATGKRSRMLSFPTVNACSFVGERGFPQRSIAMLRRCLVIAFSLLLFFLAERQGAAANWHAVSDEERRLTAADIGDPEADAAILFREGHLDDTSPDGTTLRVYLRIKIFNERGRRYADVQLPYRVELGRITDVSARTIRADGSVIDVTSRDIFDRVMLK